MRPRGGLGLPGARARAEDRGSTHEDISTSTLTGTFRAHLQCNHFNSFIMEEWAGQISMRVSNLTS